MSECGLGQGFRPKEDDMCGARALCVGLRLESYLKRKMAASRERKKLRDPAKKKLPARGM